MPSPRGHFHGPKVGLENARAAVEVQRPGIGGLATASNCNSRTQSVEQSCEETVGFGDRGVFFETCIGHENSSPFSSELVCFLVMQAK